MASLAFNLYLILSSILGLGFARLDEDWVGFDITSMIVPENIGEVEICISMQPFLEVSVDGRVFTTNPDTDAPITSVGNLSYEYKIHAVVNPTFCYNATVIDNNIVEFGKKYYLNITSNKQSLVPVNENRSTLEIFITNNDRVSIAFSKTSLTVSESDGNLTVCMKRRGEARNLGEGNVPSGALSVRLSTVHGTASNDDFTPLNSDLVNFGLNEMFKCINVTINNDVHPEPMETFYIIMTNGSSYVTVNETRNSLTVNIMNDDKATAQFEEEYREIEENDENKGIELGCVIEPQSQIPLQIGFEIDGFSSTAVDSEDFIYNKSLPFPPWENRVSLQIKIIHDRVAESPEILVLRMISLNESLVIIGKNNKAKVKILDKFDNEEAAIQKQKQEQIENEKRNEVYTLLIVAIVLIALLFLCGIVVCVCFRIKSKQA